MKAFGAEAPAMPISKESTELLDVVAKILLRSFAIGYALLLIWAAMLLLTPDFLVKISKPFDVTPHEVMVINYCGVAFVKCWLLVFFLFPYVAIRLVLRRKS
jgi:hypothetical protein